MLFKVCLVIFYFPIFRQQCHKSPHPFVLVATNKVSSRLVKQLGDSFETWVLAPHPDPVTRCTVIIGGSRVLALISPYCLYLAAKRLLSLCDLPAHRVVTLIHDMGEGMLKNGRNLLTLLFSTSLDLLISNISLIATDANLL